jgi:hypothetical protein
MQNQPNLIYQNKPARDPILAPKIQSTKPRFLRQTCVALASLALGIAACAPHSASAASSAGCDGGGFAILQLSGEQKDITVPAASLPPTFLVKGKYVEFTVDAATFGLYNWTLTGVANPLDITGGKRTVVFSSKLPDHRGLVLTSDLTVDSSGDSIVISREGAGLSMKIQAKDCANGGLFQVEVERDDLTATVFTHILGDSLFYYDNPNVRDLLGENLPCSGVLPDGTPVVCNGANPDGTVTVTARVNFGNDLSDKFVGRDSPQVATRITPGFPNNIPNPFHPGVVDHLGAVSQWSVSSGGRMGQVMGEDATEIAPAATACTENCTAQNQVNGKAVVVGFPFPVPAEVRLQPRTSAPGTGLLTAVTLSAISVSGGGTVEGLATLNGTAPAAGVPVTLTSSNPVIASVPAKVVIPAGATSAKFTITTKPVTSLTPVTLTGNAAGLTKTAILGVNPPAPPVTDTVAVQKTEYTTKKKTLLIEATSSSTNVTMTVSTTSTGVVLGTLANKGGGKYQATLSVATNPVNITVKSSGGGSATRAVTVK